MTNLVWLKRDLRLFDHAPLTQANRSALRNDLNLLIVYILEDQYWELEENSFRHWEFIKQALLEIRQKLKLQSNQNLLVLKGDAIECFAKLHRQFNLNAVYSHEETGIDWTYKRDIKVAKFCRKMGTHLNYIRCDF